ncbi:MAG: hypothetical protein GX299_04045 [Epulopiscium sp.]|jgi:hypothetical protein|nr:hypothetical protein [Candidatus Epulonipiscium sp.]
MKQALMKQLIAGIMATTILFPTNIVLGATKTEVYNALQNALYTQNFHEMSANYQEQEKAFVSQVELGTGVICAELQDFDGDNQLELMTVSLEKKGTIEEMTINIYKYVAGKVNLANSFLIGTFTSSTFQKQECRVMIKTYDKKYICAQYQGIGDLGAKQEIVVLEYKGDKLDVKMQAKTESSVAMNDLKGIADNLYSLGFKESAKIFGKSGYGYTFSETEANLMNIAKVSIENGIVNIFDYTDTQKIKVMLNGDKLSMDSLPVVKNGRTLVPLRDIAEAMGATISWDSRTKRITLEKDDTIMHMFVDKKKAYLNGQEKSLDVVPQIINNKTYVPVRFISENLNAKVNWVATSQTIQIEY